MDILIPLSPVVPHADLAQTLGHVFVSVMTFIFWLSVLTIIAFVLVSARLFEEGHFFQRARERILEIESEDD